MTAGAPPPSSILKKMQSLGFEVMHVYGLTETYGHISHCAWNDEWNNHNEEKKSEIKSYQGVRYPHTEGGRGGLREILPITLKFLETEKLWVK